MMQFRVFPCRGSKYKRKFSDEEKEQIITDAIHLKKRGYSQGKITKELKVNYNTLLSFMFQARGGIAKNL